MSRGNLPKDWSKIKKRWKKKHPPDVNGNYQCWLCPEKVHESVVTLDHVAPIAQYPEYARNLSNLRPAHRWCNEERAARMEGRSTTNLMRGRKILKRQRR